MATIALTESQQRVISNYLDLLSSKNLTNFEDVKISHLVSENVYFLTYKRGGDWSFPIQINNGKYSAFQGFQVPVRTFKALYDKKVIIKEDNNYVLNKSYLINDYFPKTYKTEYEKEFFKKKLGHIFKSPNIKGVRIKTIDVTQLTNEKVNTLLSNGFNEVENHLLGTDFKRLSGYYLTIIYDNGKVVGYIFYSKRKNSIFIEMIETKSEFQGKKYAVKLLKGVIAEQKLNKISGNITNESQFEFWENFGTHMGNQELEYTDDDLDDLDIYFEFNV